MYSQPNQGQWSPYPVPPPPGRARRKPRWWWYWTAGALIVAGVVSFVLMFRSLFGFTDGMTRMAAPGETRLALEPGSYLISYESRSVLDGKPVTGPDLPPELAVTVLSPDGDPVSVRTPTVKITYDLDGTAGQVIATFTAQQQGEYVVRAERAGQDGPRVVLAVGANRFGHLGLKIAGGVLGTLAGISLLVITLVRRSSVPRLRPS
jgi:hypothetical protein